MKFISDRGSIRSKIDSKFPRSQLGESDLMLEESNDEKGESDFVVESVYMKIDDARSRRRESWACWRLIRAFLT